MFKTKILSTDPLQPLDLRKWLRTEAKLILVDFDGVLSDTVMIHARAEAASILAVTGIQVSVQEIYNATSNQPTPEEFFNYLKVIPALAKQYPICLDCSSFLEFNRVNGDDHDISILINDLVKEKKTQFNDIVENNPPAPNPKTTELLQLLRSNRSDIKICIVSSSSRTGPLLKAMGLDKYFDDILTGSNISETRDEITFESKYDFIKWLQLKYGISGAHSIIIEDEPKHISNPKNMNLVSRGIGIHRDALKREELSSAGADMVFETIEELYKFLIQELS